MTDEEIKELPTILTILDQIAAEEDGLRNDKRWSFLSNLGAEDKYEIFAESPQGPCVLKPTATTFNSYFRGQTKYYEKCVPTIYRSTDSEERDQVDIFIDRLRSSEFELLLRTHPFVNLIFDQGIIFSNFGEDVWVHLKVDYLGLAQHYELNTDVLDFTNDKWIAAFFATCEKQNGRYFPIDESTIEYNEDKYGVIYRYTDDVGKQSKFSVIGLQPFKRPGEQKGFLLQLSKNENLNYFGGIEKYFFKHDRMASEIIYNRMNTGKDLFPYDILEELAKKIKSNRKVSLAAFNNTFKEYPIDHMDAQSIKKACNDRGIKFVNYPVVSFPKGIEKEFLKSWQNGGEAEFFSKIVYRPVYALEE